MRDLCAMKVFRGKRRATLRLPGRSGAGWEEPGAGGPPSSGNSTNQSAKARAITTNSNSNPVHEIARHVTVDQGCGALWHSVLCRALVTGAAHNPASAQGPEINGIRIFIR